MMKRAATRGESRLVRLCFALLLAVAIPGCTLIDDDEASGSGGDGDGDGDGSAGSPCALNTDCDTGLVCSAGLCQSPGTIGVGGPCSATRDCTTGLFCNETGICAPGGAGGVGDRCITGADCLPELTCVKFGFGGTCEEAGEGDIGEACMATTECLPGMACGADGTCRGSSEAFPPFEGAECADDESPFRIFFEVPRAGAQLADFFRLPFPTDVRVDDAGNLDMSDFPRPGPGILGFDIVDRYVEALVADFDGFSTMAPVYFRFSSRLQFDVPTLNEAIEYVDITGEAPEFGTSRSFRYRYTTSRTQYNCQNRLSVRNTTRQPLLPGHTYAVYVTTDVLSEDGSAAAAQDSDLAAVLGDTRPTDADLGAAWDKHQPFRDYLADQTIAADSIAGVAVFTVQDPTARMAALAAAAAAEDPPILQDLTLCDTGVTSPCEAGGSRTCGAPNNDYFEIHGRVRIPIYQRGTAPYEFPELGGDIALGGGGAPEKQRDELVCFAMTVPKVDAPVDGFPLIVFGHGTGGSFRSFINNGVGPGLATSAAPMVTIGFEGVVHGDRRNGSTRDPDDLMFNIVNPLSARDNNLQGAVDVLHLFRLPEVGTISVAGVPDFELDGAAVNYFGHSQGSNVGTPALAVSDVAAGAVLSGAGAFLTDSLTAKTSPVNSLEALKLVLNEPGLDADHPVMSVLQNFFDSSDMVNYAPLLVRRPPDGVASKHVYMSYGATDTFSPAETLQAMARSTGLDQVAGDPDDLGVGTTERPVTLNVTAGDGPGRTAAVFQYAAPDGVDGHFVAFQVPQAVADWTAFLTSLIADGVPAVP